MNDGEADASGYVWVEDAGWVGYLTGDGTRHYAMVRHVRTGNVHNMPRARMRPIEPPEAVEWLLRRY